MESTVQTAQLLGKSLLNSIAPLLTRGVCGPLVEIKPWIPELRVTDFDPYPACSASADRLVFREAMKVPGEAHEDYRKTAFCP